MIIIIKSLEKVPQIYKYIIIIITSLEKVLIIYKY